MLYPGRLQRPGTTPTLQDWTSNVTSPWRPEAFTSDVKLPLFLRPLTTPRARRAWASPKFFLLRLNRRRTAYFCAGLPTFRLTDVPAYQRSGLPTRHQLFILLGFLIVHLQFKRNIYLSLLCDWIFLCLQNHFSFPFFQVCS